MIKYRPHRGSLEDSLSEIKEFETEEEMLNYICETWKLPHNIVPFTYNDLVIGEVEGDDDRIGWKNVRHIGTKRMFNEDYIEKYGCPQCIAWCGE